MGRRRVLADRLGQALAEEITGGRPAPGEFLPSEKQLGEQFGVSRITVRNALAHLAAAGVIVSLPGKGWQIRLAPPSASATAASAGRPVPPQQRGGRVDGREVLLFSRPVMAGELFQGAEEVLGSAGYRLRLLLLDESDLQMQQVVRQIRAAAPAGCCVFNDRYMSGPVGEELAASGPPLVLCGSREYLFCDTVAFDLQEGGRRMMLHLKELGYRRVVYYGYSYLPGLAPSFAARLAGAREGAERAGIGLEIVETDYRADYDAKVQNALLRRLRAGRGPRSCAFCDTNHLAAVLLRMLLREGVAVPQTCGVCGFGSSLDNGVILSGGAGLLSCVHEDWRQAGQVCAWRLLARLRGEASAPQQVLLPPGVLPGDSLCDAHKG